MDTRKQEFLATADVGEIRTWLTAAGVNLSGSRQAAIDRAAEAAEDRVWADAGQQRPPAAPAWTEARRRQFAGWGQSAVTAQSIVLGFLSPPLLLVLFALAEGVGVFAGLSALMDGDLVRAVVTSTIIMLGYLTTAFAEAFLRQLSKQTRARWTLGRVLRLLATRLSKAEQPYTLLDQMDAIASSLRQLVIWTSIFGLLVPLLDGSAVTVQGVISIGLTWFMVRAMANMIQLLIGFTVESYIATGGGLSFFVTASAGNLGPQISSARRAAEREALATIAWRASKRRSIPLPSNWQPNTANSSAPLLTSNSNGRQRQHQ